MAHEVFYLCLHAMFVGLDFDKGDSVCLPPSHELFFVNKLLRIVCLNAYRCMTPECDGVEDMREDVSAILTWYYAHQTTVSVHDGEGDCFLFTTFSRLIHDGIVEEPHVAWLLRCWVQSFELLVAL